MKLTYQKIKSFVIKHHILLVITIVPLGALFFLTGLIAYNESSNFCYSCHFNKGQFHYIDKNLPVHKNIDDGAFSCITCHKDKSVQHIYLRNAKEIKINAQLLGNLQRTPIADSKAVYNSEQCLTCHPDRLDVTEREPYLLKSDGLKKLGLRFDKRLHYRFEIFSQTDQKLYEELTAKAFLDDNEKDELTLLEKISTSYCAQCHVQQKIMDEKSVLDKQVNFIARNPISCAGCHEDAMTINHPGRLLKSPTKEVCQKCHHGKIHGKFLIFKADCEAQQDTEHCVKCHPLYKSEISYTLSK